MTNRQAIEEGLADHAAEREEADAREQLVSASLAVLDRCCDECERIADTRGEHRRAYARAIAAGVMDDQPGEVEWLTMHRLEREEVV